MTYMYIHMYIRHNSSSKLIKKQNVCAHVYKYVNVFVFALAGTVYVHMNGVVPVHACVCLDTESGCSQDPVPPHSSTSPHVFY